MTTSSRFFWPFLSICAFCLFAGCTSTPTHDVNIVFEGTDPSTIDVGQSATIAVNVSNDNGQGVSWSCSGSCSASNLSSEAHSSVVFKATQAGTATITATAKQEPSFSRSMTITILNVPSLPGGALPGATIGVAYNQSVGETGGVTPLNFSISSGSLPAGLSLNSTSGAISGNPSGSPGTSTFTVAVKDSGSPALSASAQYTIAVQYAPGTLFITTTSPLPPGAVGAVYTTTISATGGTQPYTFSIDSSGTQLPAGLALANSNNQAVISGTPTAAGAFTNILVDVHDSNQPTVHNFQTAFALTITASALTVTPPSGVLPNAFQGTAYTQAITATGGTTPYTFSLDQSSAQLPAGLMFTSTGAGGSISGTPTALGTTTGIVVDVKDSTPGATPQQFTYSLTVTQPCGTGSESLLNGQYSMLVKGFDNGKAAGESGPEPIMIGGEFYTDGNGNVVAGLLDVNSNSTHGAEEGSVTGTYQIGSDHRGCMALTTALGTQNFRISLADITSGVASKAHMIEFDGAGPFTSGVMLKDDVTTFNSATISGNYAFEMASPGGSGSSGGGKQAVVGVISLTAGSGPSGTVTGMIDLNDAGRLDAGSTTSWSAATPLTIGSGGTYYIGSGIGNVNFTVMIDGNPVQVEVQVYIVSSTELLIMSGGDETQSGVLFGGGVALKQSSTSFSGSSLNGISVLHTSGLQGSPSSATSSIGTLTFDGSGGASLNAWQNNGTAIQNTTWTGTVQVAADGRVTFATGGGTDPPVFWLADKNEGFYLGAGSNAESGAFEPQTSTTVSGGAPYAFGSINPELPGTDQQVGVATLSGGNVTGTIDDNMAGTLTAGTPLSKTLSVDATGLGMVPSGCTVGTMGTGGCQQIFYVISATRAVILNLQTGGGQLVSAPLETADQ